MPPEKDSCTCLDVRAVQEHAKAIWTTELILENYHQVCEDGRLN